MSFAHPREPRLALPLATLLAVVSATLLVHHGSLLAPAPHVDEATYLRAFALAAAGADPYAEPDFLYPPAFAMIGATLRAWTGPWPLLAGLRAGCVAGLWLLAWASLREGPWPLAAKTAVALALPFSPLVWRGLFAGNVSLLVVGALVALLAVAPRRPAQAGLLLGVLNAMKPMGVSALVVLAAPRGARRPPDGVVRAAIVAAATIAGTLLIGHRWQPSMLERAGGLPDALRNGSLARVLAALGLRAPPALLFLVLTAAGALVAWRWGRDHRARVAVAASTSLLALPVVNPDTFLLAVPAQVLALERAAHGLVRAWRAGSGWPRALATAALVAAAVLGAHGAEGTSATGELPSYVQGLVTLIPLAAVIATTLFAVRGGPRRDDAQDRAAAAGPGDRKSSPMAAGRARLREGDPR